MGNDKKDDIRTTNGNNGSTNMKYECIYGYIDNDGNEILYDDVCDMSEGMIAVKLNGKWGYINETGKLIIPFVYDEAWAFSEGLATVALGIAWGCIDKAGHEVIPVKYDYVSDCSNNGLHFASLNDEEFIIDKTGRELIREVNHGEDLDLFPDFHEGMASVRYNGKYGFLNDKGDEVIPFKYDCAGHFNEGLAAVKSDGKWGFIDKADNIVIPFRYDDARSFNEGVAAVKFNGKWGFIDKNDNVIIPFKYDDAGRFNEGWANVESDEKWGFIDKADNVVISFRYDYADEFDKKGLAAARLKGKLGDIDRQGNFTEWRL
ncbi:MAG: WG repeat-containing protein [Bacteroidales bacterium]|nr:WG repeat-containing protein [Bacteroidales bacterium]